MDFSTSVRTDSLPALATLLLPGMVATLPWALLAVDLRPSIGLWFAASDARLLATTTIASLLAGLVLESAGSYVEVYWIDHHSPKRAERRAHWNAYLRMKTGPGTDAIGHRYLRRTLTSFKFELNLFVALLSLWPCVALLGFRGWFNGWTIEVLLAIVAMQGICFRAAWDSSEVLASVRAVLLDSEPALVRLAQRSVQSE